MKALIHGETHSDNPQTHNIEIQLIDSEVTLLCGAGTDDCCIFLTMGRNGWNCERWNPPVYYQLLSRFHLGKMVATRQGCDFVNNLDVDKLIGLATELGEAYIFPTE